MLDDATLGTVIFAWSCLMISPVGLAAGQALNRAMRKLNENTVSTYTNFTSIFIWLAVILAVGQDLAIFMEFNWIDWSAMVGCSVFFVLSMIFNFKAT